MLQIESEITSKKGSLETPLFYLFYSKKKAIFVVSIFG